MADGTTWVTLTLAHPISAAQAEQLRAREIKDYRPTEEITVPYDIARAIIGSGRAAVDPEDHQAVQEALSRTSTTSATTATTATAANGTTSTTKTTTNGK